MSNAYMSDYTSSELNSRGWERGLLSPGLSTEQKKRSEGWYAHTTPEPDIAPTPDKEPIPPEVPVVDPQPNEVPQTDPIPIQDPIPHQAPVSG